MLTSQPGLSCNVRPSTPLSLAAHLKPQSAASVNAASDTEPSDGHKPRGVTPSVSRI